MLRMRIFRLREGASTTSFSGNTGVTAPGPAVNRHRRVCRSSRRGVASSTPFAAIYLAGFTVEMILKTAAFIVDGAGRGDAIVGRLGPAKNYGTQRFPEIKCESYHSLRFWAAFLEHKRIDLGKPFPGPLLAELQTRTVRASETWWIEMRYHPAAPSAAVAQVEVLTLLEDVDWFLKNHGQLWS